MLKAVPYYPKHCPQTEKRSSKTSMTTKKSLSQIKEIVHVSNSITDNCVLMLLTWKFLTLM